jgi:hypothetical protein
MVRKERLCEEVSSARAIVISCGVPHPCVLPVRLQATTKRSPSQTARFNMTAVSKL